MQIQNGPAVRASILEGISFYHRKGYPPTLRELMGHAGLTSLGHVRYHLGVLRSCGEITWEPGRCRTIRLVGAADDD